MSFHARPIPAPARVPGGHDDTSRAQVTFTSPLDDPLATLPTTSSAASHGTTLATVVEATAARDTPWPWYRREPWLPVAMAAFVPIAVGFETPQEYHALRLGVSGVSVVLSIAMLLRQGPFRERPRPAAALDRTAAARR
jgi:hypothetical protein